MTPAGDEEIVVAVEPQFDGALQPAGSHRRHARKDRRLRLLAAEAAAHAPALDVHLIGMQVQGMRDQMLHFARVLGRAMDMHRTALFRNRVADLAFQIELLLTAHIELRLESMRRFGDGRLRTAFIGAAHQMHRGEHVQALRVGILRRQHRRGGRNAQHIPGFGSRTAGRIARFGNHCEHRLAEVADIAPRRTVVVLLDGAQDRVVVNDRTAVVAARNIDRRQHRDHARHGADHIEPHGRQAAAGDGRQAQRAVQGAGQLRNVVDVGRFAGDVQHCRFMRPTDADPGPLRLCPGLGMRVDAGGRVGQVVGEGFGRFEQAGVDGLVHVNVLRCRRQRPRQAQAWMRRGAA